VSWSATLKSKQFLVRDQYDAMIDAIAKDPFIAKVSPGIRRKVCLSSPSDRLAFTPTPTPTQVFLVFFSNLTTRVADVEIRLNNMNTSRDVICKKFKLFRKLYEDTKESIHKGAPKKKRRQTKQDTSGKAATREEEADLAYEKALSGATVADITNDMSVAEKAIRSIGWDPMKFVHEWGMNNRIMALDSYKNSHRDSNRRGERMLTMSGLTWNKGSHAQDRDWWGIEAAITLETALVEHYRFDLLKSCSGIRALRNELKALFLSIVTPFHERNFLTGLTEVVVKWDFPDGMDSTTTGPSEPESYDAERHRKDVIMANPGGGLQLGNKRRDVRFTVSNLEKNSLLWCSDPEVPAGTVETLAHDCIVVLARVRPPFGPRESLSRRLNFCPDNALQRHTTGLPKRSRWR
jgi:hypothetical protein